MGSLRDLELRHLAALTAVVDEGSFGRAATALGFTQSAISQQIAALEKAVGMPLFDRPKGPRRAELTPAGELLLVHARTMLAGVDAMADELDRMRRGITGRLVIGTFQSVSAQILPAAIGRMRQLAPDVDIRLFETDSQEELLHRLLADELDLTFTVDCPPDTRLDSVVLGEDPFVVLARAGELTGPRATTDDLNGHPMIGQTADQICQVLIDERLVGLGVRPDYVFRSQDNGAVQGMVRSGMGRAVMPSLAVDADDPGVDVLELEPAIAPRTIELTRRAGRTLLAVADTFETVVLEVTASMLHPPRGIDPPPAGPSDAPARAERAT